MMIILTSSFFCDGFVGGNMKIRKPWNKRPPNQNRNTSQNQKKSGEKKNQKSPHLH